MVALLSAYIGMVSVFQNFGVNIVLTNQYYKKPKLYKLIWRNLIGMLLLWNVIYTFATATILFFIIPDTEQENAAAIILLKVTPLLFLATFEQCGLLYFRLRQHALFISTVSLVVGCFGVLLNYFFIAELRLGYMGWLYSEFITASLLGGIYFVALVFVIRIIPIVRINIGILRHALRVGLPTVPHYYSSYLLTGADRAIMDRLGIAPGDIGRYSLSFNFGAYVDVVTNAINQAVGPNLYEFIRDKRWQDYSKVIFYFQALIFVGCFIGALWFKEWLPLLVRNEALLGVDFILPLLLMSFAYRPMYIGINQTLFYHEKTNKVWLITFVAAIIKLVLSVVLLWIAGVIGAAIASLIAFLYMGFSGIFLKDFQQYNSARLFSTFWFVMIVVGSALAVFCSTASTQIRTLITCSLLAVILAIYRRYFLAEYAIA